MNTAATTNTFGAAVSFDDTQIAFSAKTDAELFKTYLLFASINQNWLVKWGTGFVNFALKSGLPVKGLLRETIFRQFCGGQHIADCTRTIEQLAHYGIGTILDYSVEGAETEESFAHTQAETIATIRQAAQMRQQIPFCVFKVTGIAPFALLEKISASLSQPNSMPMLPSDKKAWDRVRVRVDSICATAHQNKVRIFIDGEESWIQEAIDALAYEMMEKYNREGAIVYNTYQLYTRAALDKLRQARTLAVKQGFYVGAKLVRGAYMEKERLRAQQLAYPDPIQPDKASTDRDFDAALKFCLDHKQRIALCAGTHNEQSCYYLAALMEKYNVAKNDPDVFFAQLYGMSDNISYNLAKAGYNVAKYVPYGPLEAVMPYLFRRAEENTSVAGQSSREFMLVKKERQRRAKARR